MRQCGYVGLLVVVLVAGGMGGCSSIYFEALEGLGIPKRDVLVTRVKDARDEQDEAKEQFRSALEAFSQTVGFDGGSLQAKYDKLNQAYQQSEQRARAVSNRIAAVESVANALFREWESEIREYNNPDLRRKSEAQLAQTKSRYSLLVAAMRRAESRMQPVLDTFRDQVLFLKHNLNAQAIASLEGEVEKIEIEVNDLVMALEASIDEANAFIDEMGLNEA